MVVTKSPVLQLAPYFGQTVQFPLGRTLNVKKGYVIALTVPTWAPALTPLLTDKSAWRASRPEGKCNDTSTLTAQLLLRDDTITEVMVNGPNIVYIEQRGKLTMTPIRFANDEHVLKVIDRIIRPLGRRINRKWPMVDARLAELGIECHTLISFEGE